MAAVPRFDTGDEALGLELIDPEEEARKAQEKLMAELRAAHRFRDDFPTFAAAALKIRDKDGKISALVLNDAQVQAHRQIEEQRAREGKVRALILKARQQGFSTYIEARFYWRVIYRRGVEAFILTHQQMATDNLFKMVARYHEHCPPNLKPRTGQSNAKELAFDLLGSGYSVGTAGTVAVGRSKTIQFLHGSEVSRWLNANDHFAGVVEAVPDAPGTEIILETTGNGPSGAFYERWQDAARGVGDYGAIFVPWFVTREYRRGVPPGFTLDSEEQKYAKLFDLDLAQMAWRRAKIIALKDPMMFMQEYPATASEAFQAVGQESFISGNLVYAARKATLEGFGPLVIGVDPKREGEDRFAIAWRRGRKVERVWSDPAPIKTLEAAGKIKGIIDADKPARVFIDLGGNGAGIYDVLCSWGYPYMDICRVVNFGSKPLEPDRWVPGDGGGTYILAPKNRRAEMWRLSRDWLEEEGGADIPDKESLSADATAPGFDYDTNQRLVLQPKEDLGKRSPDEWDAIALTFAEPVAEVRPRREGNGPPPRKDGWMG